MSNINSCCGHGNPNFNVNVFPNQQNGQTGGFQLPQLKNQSNGASSQISFGTGNNSGFTLNFGNPNTQNVANDAGKLKLWTQPQDGTGQSTSARPSYDQGSKVNGSCANGNCASTSPAGKENGKVLGDFTQKDLDLLRREGLKNNGSGATFSPELKEALSKVAVLMDNDPKTYPKPDSGSWVNEVKEDNYLDAKEAGNFRAAITQLLGKGSEVNGKWGQSDVEQMRGGLLKVDPRTGGATFDEKDRDLLSKLAVSADAALVAGNSSHKMSMLHGRSLNDAIKSGNTLTKEQTEQLTKAIGEQLSKATNNQTIDKLTAGNPKSVGGSRCNGNNSSEQNGSGQKVESQLDKMKLMMLVNWLLTLLGIQQK